MINDRFEDQEIVILFSEDARAALAFARLVGSQTLSFVAVDPQVGFPLQSAAVRLPALRSKSPGKCMGPTRLRR